MSTGTGECKFTLHFSLFSNWRLVFAAGMWSVVQVQVVQLKLTCSSFFYMVFLIYRMGWVQQLALSFFYSGWLAFHSKCFGWNNISPTWVHDHFAIALFRSAFIDWRCLSETLNHVFPEHFQCASGCTKISAARWAHACNTLLEASIVHVLGL